MFSVRNDEVDMYLDCERVDTEPLDPRGRIAINGEITLGKNSESRVTERVSLSNIPLFESPLCVGILALFFNESRFMGTPP